MTSLPTGFTILIKERQLSASSVNVAVNAVLFLYRITLGRNTEALAASVPHMKHPIGIALLI